MPRKLRIQYPGAIYHVMSRGDGKGDIFLDDATPSEVDFAPESYGAQPATWEAMQAGDGKPTDLGGRCAPVKKA